MPDGSRGICVFSPGLRLTVTVEAGADGDEIHLHPGGQGYWMARSVERLGEPVVLCTAVGGEVGDVVTSLVRSQSGMELITIGEAAFSSISVYDRRYGTRELFARAYPTSMDRHAADQLYSLTLATAIRRGCCVLAGNLDTGVVPPGYYGRLSADLHAVGVPVIADVHGPELAEILDRAPVQLIKLSRDDLRADGVVDDRDDSLVDAVTELAARVSNDLVVTRGAGRPAVAWIGAEWYTVSTPQLDAVDWHGAGDAMVGGLAVAHVRGLAGCDAVRFGAAAGAASVTRRGLASLDRELVEALVPKVRVTPVGDAGDAVRS